MKIYWQITDNGYNALNRDRCVYGFEYLILTQLQDYELVTDYFIEATLFDEIKYGDTILSTLNSLKDKDLVRTLILNDEIIKKIEQMQTLI